MSPGGTQFAGVPQFADWEVKKKSDAATKTIRRHILCNLARSAGLPACRPPATCSASVNSLSSLLFRFLTISNYLRIFINFQQMTETWLQIMVHTVNTTELYLMTESTYGTSWLTDWLAVWRDNEIPLSTQGHLKSCMWTDIRDTFRRQTGIVWTYTDDAKWSKCTNCTTASAI